MEYISSAENRNIKLAKSLKLKKYRDAENLFLIEGVRIIMDALESNVQLKCVFVNEKVNLDELDSKFKSLPNLYIISEKLFAQISETESSQGVIAIANQKSESVDKGFLNYKNVIILENVQDPGNLGSIIRTADAANIDAIILVGNCADIYNGKVVRSTMGSLFRVEIIKSESIKDICDVLRANNFKIYVTYLNGNNFYNNVDFSHKTAIVFGNEGSGVSEKAVTEADSLVKIPMPGSAESLNVATAVAVVAFEGVRQTMQIIESHVDL